MFQSRADRNIFVRRGRQIDSRVGPARIAVDTLGLRFDVESGSGERLGKILLRGSKVGRVLESRRYHVRGLQCDGELVAETRVIRAGIERREGRDQGESRKSEIP